MKTTETSNPQMKIVYLNTRDTNNVQHKSLEGLSPFKKIIGIALQNGEDRNVVAERMSLERKMPLATAKAYVTMVVKYLDGDIMATKIRSTGLLKRYQRLTPFKKAILDAIVSGENDDAIIKRISSERNMPMRTAQAYVTMVKNAFLD